jgi:hypothetical protein|nr:MAG TPA: hypothetical protein [Caudoviricetes sp.]
MDGNMTPADIMAMTKDDDGMANIWNNPFVYLIWIWAFRMFGNGFGNDAATQSALTRADLFEGFNNQGVNDKLNDITTGLCNSFATVNSNLCQGFNSVNSGLAENRFAQQQCCCETKQAIANLAAENYRNTCDITTAIHSEGEATRALITENAIQALRDKLADKDRDILYANLQLSQKEQNETLIDVLRPVSRPAYITCSPYTSANSYCANGYNGGCGA